jgi:hypothetical protein
MSTQSVQMTLETNKFRELLREAYELSLISYEPKYDLKNEESLRNYELWAPYIMKNQKQINSIGYKVFMIELMSILLVMKDEENNRNRYKVSADEIKEMYKINPPREVCKKPQPETQNAPEKNYVHSSQENVINFADYKTRRKS